MEITNRMLAMKMIEEAHSNLGDCVQLFVSYCGSLPARTAANNSLSYKFIRFGVAHLLP
jgi:hypothetical protein